MKPAPPATVDDATGCFWEAITLNDPVILRHKFLYYHLKADALSDTRLPSGEGPDRPAWQTRYRGHLQRHAPRVPPGSLDEIQRDGWEIEVVDLRSVKPAVC